MTQLPVPVNDSLFGLIGALVAWGLSWLRKKLGK